MTHKVFILFVSLFIFIRSGPAQVNDWENNELQHSPLVKLLNGTWKFSHYNNPSPVPSNFYRTTNIRDWDDIQVPGNWQLQSDKYDPPGFTNIKYPFEPNPPFVPDAWKGLEIFGRSVK